MKKYLYEYLLCPQSPIYAPDKGKELSIFPVPYWYMCKVSTFHLYYYKIRILPITFSKPKLTISAL